MVGSPFSIHGDEGVGIVPIIVTMIVARAAVDTEILFPRKYPKLVIAFAADDL